MNSIHYLVRQHERFCAVFRIQPLISPTEAEHLLYAIGVMHFEKQRPDDIVESGTKSSAGNNTGTSFRWMEEQIFACSRQFKEEAIFWRRINGPKYRSWNTLQLISP